MNPPSKRRDHAIEALRWMSILAVVLHHGIVKRSQSPETIDQIHSFKLWIEWCVPAFFYVSGRLLRSSGTRDFAVQTLKRARRLLVPYIGVSFLSFLLLWLAANLGSWSFTGESDLTFRALGIKLVWLSGFGPQLYFLPYLFLVGLLASAAVLLVPTRWLSVLAAALFLWVGFGWMLPYTALGQGLQQIPAFLLAFSLGVSDKAWEGSRGELAHAAATTLGACALAFHLDASWPIALAIPLLLYRLLRRIPLRRVVEALDRLGNPGGIFLWHAPILLPACSVALSFLHVRDWPNYLLSCFAAIAFSLVIDAFVARIPLLKELRL